MNTDLVSARSVAEKTAQQVGEFLASGFGAPVELVSDGANSADAVTTYDVEAEERFAEAFSRFDSSIGFRGEESGHHGSQETFWLVDAIGGTGHFMRGTLFSSSMISLIDDGEVVVAVIRDFVNRRTFAASKDGGATCNSESIHVADRALSRSYVAAEIRLDGFDNAGLLAQIQGTAVVVSMANYGWEFTNTALGVIDAVVTKDPWGGPWDFAPGALLVQEAGGVVTDLSGERYDYKNLDLIAASPRVHEGLLSVLEGPVSHQ